MTDDAIDLCATDAVPPGASRGFSVQYAGQPLALFVVHSAGRFYAYRNSCPHTGAPLEWVADRFLDADGRLIQCATHAALFRIEDGLCISGPCAGDALGAIELRVVASRILLYPAGSGGQ